MTSTPAVMEAGLPVSAGLGIRGGLSYLADCHNATHGDAAPLCNMDYNRTAALEDEMVGPLMERIVSYVVPLIFLVIVVVGLIGNALVSVTVRKVKSKRTKFSFRRTE